MLDVMPKQYELSDAQAESLGKLFARKRKEAGFERQFDAAQHLHVSQDLISRAERSFSVNMRIGDLGVIMQAYHIDPREVYELMGLYAPVGVGSPEKDYIDREVLPLLLRLRMDALHMMRKIAETMLPNGK